MYVRVHVVVGLIRQLPGDEGGRGRRLLWLVKGRCAEAIAVAERDAK